MVEVPSEPIVGFPITFYAANLNHTVSILWHLSGGFTNMHVLQIFSVKATGNWDCCRFS